MYIQNLHPYFLYFISLRVFNFDDSPSMDFPLLIALLGLLFLWSRLGPAKSRHTPISPFLYYLLPFLPRPLAQQGTRGLGVHEGSRRVLLGGKGALAGTGSPLGSTLLTQNPRLRRLSTVAPSNKREVHTTFTNDEESPTIHTNHLKVLAPNKQ